MVDFTLFQKYLITAFDYNGMARMRGHKYMLLCTYGYYGLFALRLTVQLAKFNGNDTLR